MTSARVVLRKGLRVFLIFPGGPLTRCSGLCIMCPGGPLERSSGLSEFIIPAGPPRRSSVFLKLIRVWDS